MRKILIAAIIGFVLGFVAVSLAFAFRLIHLDPSVSFVPIFISMALLTGILGAITGIIVWYFFKINLSVARGILWGIAFYWSLVIALSLISIFMFNLHPDISYLPNIPGDIFFQILKPLLVKERPFHLWDHPYIEYFIITTSWFSYTILGGGIAYLFTIRKPMGQ